MMKDPTVKDVLEKTWIEFEKKHPELANRDIANKAIFFAGFRAGVERSFDEILRKLSQLQDTSDR